MKLLEKKQINEVVQKERKTVIDSGIFLANKVDLLRQDLLNLEKQRADFIQGSRDKLKEAISDLKEQKDNLFFEVKEAQKQLLKLREPLDEEWQKVQNLKEELESAEETIRLIITGLANDRQELDQKIETVNALENKAISNEKNTKLLLDKATQDKTATWKLKREAQSLKDGKEAELFIKELSLEEREKALKTGQETLKKERLELNKEKKILSIKKQRIQ